MSFDAWVVGFGLSRVLIDLALIASPAAYGILLAVVVVDLYLLSVYFRGRPGVRGARLAVDLPKDDLMVRWQKKPSGAPNDFRP